ncbi:hypothetical protein F5J12DRAFT_782731 [Pisolithus orientalis]|uniref:uncharacterized protein n=1 Tax=Pisolithus orientalis TaxID=936130 RepID=UPI0022247373|nr:uncharacterized protein F5J12DRAFT_782731 [Pisolithus orientalis]KAI6007738.1 hypothetical protein F5J12DRAFT_782731 [Pisolithus orientalis]
MHCHPCPSRLLLPWGHLKGPTQISRGMKRAAGNKLQPRKNTNDMAKFWNGLKKVLPTKNVEPDMLHSPSSFVAVPNGNEVGPSIYSFDHERNPIVDAPLHEFVEHKYPASAHENEPLRSPALSDATMGTRSSTTSQSQPSLPLAITASCVAKGATWVTLKNDIKFCKACDAAAAELTPFSKHTVIVAYKKEVWTYEVHTQPIWEWALDILALHFIWDAQCLFKHDGHGFEHFYDEPWTGDSWWDIQSSLPEVPNAVPFAFIIYTNKTKLSLFGTAKGYPVVVHCANLLVEIQNSHAIGGGCIIGWLPVIHHPIALKLLSDIMQHSKTGYIHMLCHDQVTCWLFPVISILSVDYKEQHSHTEGEKVLKALGLWPVNNVFWLICNSDLYGTLSFDCLHFLHGGLWGKHILWDILRILNILGHNAETNVKNYVSNFP